MSCECESCVNHREVWNENQISFPVEYEQIFQKNFNDILATDQPDPIPNNSTPIVDLVKKDLDSRRELGLKKYGTVLQANNGRDVYQDFYEELLDAVQYVKQAIIEKNDIKNAVECLVENLEEDPGYRIGWQANIAMAFYDEFKTRYPDALGIRDLSEISNRAADSFLNLLCRDGK